MATSSINANLYSGAIASKYIPVLNAIPAPYPVKVLALAHTIIEGYYPGSKAYRTNNPGNIGTSNLGGTVGTFPTLEAGVRAQVDYITRVINGKHRAYPLAGKTTLAQYVATYAPAVENNVNAYINTIVKTFAKNGLSINSDTQLSALTGAGNTLAMITGAVIGFALIYFLNNQ